MRLKGIFLLSTLFLSGCILGPSAPDDINIISVSSGKYRDFVSQQFSLPSEEKEVLKIDFTSNYDFLDKMRHWAFNIHGVLLLGCMDESEEKIPGFLYRNGETLEEAHGGGDQKYSALSFIKSDLGKGYDLKEIPQDICFQIEGGNMMGMTFASSPIFIPKSKINQSLWEDRKSH